MLAQTKLSELVAEVDPRQMLDEDVEDVRDHVSSLVE